VKRSLLFAGAGLAVAAIAVGCSSHKNSAPAGSAVTISSSGSNAALALQNRFVQVVKTVAPSVVQIETHVGLGSGVVYDNKGDIVTNAHVVGSAKTFNVTLSDGSRHAAHLVGTFPQGDLAVVHVDGATPQAARFRHSAVAVGDVVLAIGNPLGLRSSVTQGIVSSLGRTVSEGNGVALPSVIQTSAPINPGNSGGALVDLNSEVVGIPTLAALDPEFGATPAAGIGFAISSTTVTRIAHQLISSGKVTSSGRAFLGVRIATLLSGGVLVTSVVPGGPAASAGIKPGDVVVAINKTPLQTADDLATALATVKPGTTVRVTVARNGRKLTIDVKVGELKSS
jgi:S1-C subfamily serine protease